MLISRHAFTSIVRLAKAELECVRPAQLLAKDEGRFIMKKLFVSVLLFGALFSGSGCRSITAVAPGTEAGKVLLTKTTYYVVFSQNKVQSCTIAGDKITNCTDIDVE